MNEQLFYMLSKLFLTYGYIQFYIFKCYIFIAKKMFNFYPENITPSINTKLEKSSDSQKITINNIQVDTIDVTNKGKIIIQKILWDKKIDGFNIYEFLQYIGACSIIYIDYCITNTTSESPKKMQKKINVSDEKKPQYVDEHGKLFGINFGQVSF